MRREKVWLENQREKGVDNNRLPVQTSWHHVIWENVIGEARGLPTSHQLGEEVKKKIECVKFFRDGRFNPSDRLVKAGEEDKVIHSYQEKRKKKQQLFSSRGCKMQSQWIPLDQRQQLWAQYNDSKRLNENMILLNLIRITNVLRNTCWTLSHIGTK